jgi:RNA polymerase sigma factor (sigma-70 family)
MKDLNLIHKITWSFHHTTGIDYKELFSEASLGYCEAMKSFNADKGSSFSSYAWKVINHQLIDFIRKEKHVPIPFSKASDLLQEVPITFQPEIESEFWDNLPPLCRELADVILSHMEEVPDDIAPTLARGKIVTILREQNWPWSKIWNSFREMKTVLA